MKMEQCLFDVAINGKRDASVRPNQIFAVSLYYAILDDAERARKVVEKMEKELLTPVGLRSLSPDDVSYRPIYTGSPFERDSAYHQGTVWAWLIGGFVDELTKNFRESGRNRSKNHGNFERFSNASIGSRNRTNLGNLRCRRAFQTARMFRPGVERRGSFARFYKGKIKIFYPQINTDKNRLKRVIIYLKICVYLCNFRG